MANPSMKSQLITEFLEVKKAIDVVDQEIASMSQEASVDRNTYLNSLQEWGRKITQYNNDLWSIRNSLEVLYSASSKVAHIPVTTRHTDLYYQILFYIRNNEITLKWLRESIQKLGLQTREPEPATRGHNTTPAFGGDTKSNSVTRPVPKPTTTTKSFQNFMSGISSASGSVDTAPNNSGEIYGSIGQFSADSQQTRWSCKTCNATEAEGKRRCQNCRLLSDSDYESIIKPTGGAESPRARWSCETCQGPAADGKLPCQNCRLVSGSVTLSQMIRYRIMGAFFSPSAVTHNSIAGVGATIAGRLCK